MTRGYSLLMCKMSHVSEMRRRARYEHGNSMETGGYKSRGTSRPVENWADYRVCNPYIILELCSSTELLELLDIYPIKSDSLKADNLFFGHGNIMTLIKIGNFPHPHPLPGPIFSRKMFCHPSALRRKNRTDMARFHVIETTIFLT